MSSFAFVANANRYQYKHKYPPRKFKDYLERRYGFSGKMFDDDDASHSSNFSEGRKEGNNTSISEERTKQWFLLEEW